jgi:hypothetical protein
MTKPPAGTLDQVASPWGELAVPAAPARRRGEAKPRYGPLHSPVADASVGVTVGRLRLARVSL